MKRRSALRTLAGCVVAPLFGYSLPQAAKAVEDSYGFVKIQFDYIGQEISHKGFTFGLLGNSVRVHSNDSTDINNFIMSIIPLSKKEWDNGEFYNSVNKSYKHSNTEFFEISYKDLGNVWARITPKIRGYRNPNLLSD